MHNRKGSLPFGLSPARSRTGTRWSGLLLLVSLTILLFYKSNHSFWFLSSQPYEHSCSTHLSNPSVSTSSKHSFYRTTTQHYAVNALAQLPWPASGHSSRIQHKFITDASSYRETVVRSRRHAAVKATFQKYWSAERDAATGAATGAAIVESSQSMMTDQTTMLIESLENFWIMGLTEEFKEAVAAMTEINFEPHDQITSLPQTTRLLYALLSAYDLQKCRDSRLLEKVLELGDMLYTFFDTPSRLPITSWSATKVADGVEQELSGNATLAELTTYNLAFVRLSQLTGDMRFYDAVMRVTDILESQQSSTKIPGLWPAEINLQTFDLTSHNTFDVNAASGPTYAQHALMPRLLAAAPTSSPFSSMSASALDAIIQHILFRPVTPTNESVMMASPAYTSQRYHITLTHNLDISSCTLGSTLALSAALTHNDTHLTYARLLTEGCIWTTLHAPPSFNGNMMPKNFSMLACSSSKLSNSDEDCSFDPNVWPEQEYPGFEKIWDKKGPSVRPEVVMSLFALYRVTGEERWREVGWQMWKGVEQVMEDKVEQALNGDTERDDEEFRMTMQTLKYFYLLFSKSDMLSLDEWVFPSDGGILWAGNV